MPDPAQATLYRVELPMLVGFNHPAKRRSVSDSLILSLSVDGVSGIGECAPRPYVTGETTHSVAAALQNIPIDGILKRIRSLEPAELLADLCNVGFAEVFGIHGGNNLSCLLETALLDLLGKKLGLSGAQLVPSGGAPAVEASVLAVSQVLDLSLDVEEFLATRGPFHFVKIKASCDIERDVRAAATIREHVGDVLISVDANMSWTFEEARTHVQRLRGTGVDFVEEPLAKGDWTGLAQLRAAAGDLGIMLDESVCTPLDAHQAIEAGACDAFNIRVAKNAGPVTAAKLIDLARNNGLAFQIGVQVAEVGPLINAGRALAFRHNDALTVEAGQSDRFFADTEMVVTPRPCVSRDTNTISPARGVGFGLDLEERADSWAVLHATEGRASWQPLTSRTKEHA